MKTVILLAALGLLTGCVQTQFYKSVTVTKDADGNITGRQETEAITQPGSTWPMHFEHLKVGPDFGGTGGPAKSPADAAK